MPDVNQTEYTVYSRADRFAVIGLGAGLRMASSNCSPKINSPAFQFRLRSLFCAITLIALPLAGIAGLQRLFYRSPHHRAIESVHERDGWAREDQDGYVIANMNGGTCPIRDRSLEDLLHCKKLKMLTAYGTGITDDGMRYLHVHEHLVVLHLDDSVGITDAAVPELSQLDQLQELSVTGTSISEAGLLSLRSSLPKCSVNPRPHGRLTRSHR